jgi:hypothetical protein
LFSSPDVHFEILILRCHTGQEGCGKKLEYKLAICTKRVEFHLSVSLQWRQMMSFVKLKTFLREKIAIPSMHFSQQFIFLLNWRLQQTTLSVSMNISTNATDMQITIKSLLCYPLIPLPWLRTKKLYWRMAKSNWKLCRTMTLNLNTNETSYWKSNHLQIMTHVNNFVSSYTIWETQKRTP